MDSIFSKVKYESRARSRLYRSIKMTTVIPHILHKNIRLSYLLSLKILKKS